MGADQSAPCRTCTSLCSEGRDPRERQATLKSRFAETSRRMAERRAAEQAFSSVASPGAPTPGVGGPVTPPGRELAESVAPAPASTITTSLVATPASDSRFSSSPGAAAAAAATPATVLGAAAAAASNEDTTNININPNATTMNTTTSSPLGVTRAGPSPTKRRYSTANLSRYGSSSGSGGRGPGQVARPTTWAGRLCEAADAGNFKVVKQLLLRKPSGANVDHRQQLGSGAAGTEGGNGAGGMADGDDGLSPAALWLAAFEGHAEVVDCLLSHGAAVDLEGVDAASPLLIAAQNGHLGTVQRLLASGASLDQRRADGATPLIMAAQHGSAEVTAALLAAGADVNLCDGRGCTPLYAASQNGHGEVVGALLASGAEKDAATLQGLTPLHIASANGHRTACKRLIRAGAALEAVSAVGTTPLYVPCLRGHAKIVEMLLQAGANPNVSSGPPDAYTPLLLACKGGKRTHEGIVTRLLAKGADANKAKSDGQTPLLAAAEVGNVNMVRSLVEQGGADIRISATAGGPDAFRVASAKGHREVIRYLREVKTAAWQAKEKQGREQQKQR